MTVWALDLHIAASCPTWEGMKMPKAQSREVEVYCSGNRFYSSRAGGPLVIMKDGAAPLKVLTVGQST